jgi:protein subunit release factor A
MLSILNKFMRLNRDTITKINEAYASVTSKILNEGDTLEQLKSKYEAYNKHINQLKADMEAAIAEDDRWLAREFALEIEHVTKQQNRVAEQIKMQTPSA